jgi:hypothetical protein
MLVAGKPVTEEQAREIIRCTDSFFSYPSGNDHSWIEHVTRVLWMAPDSYYEEENFEARIARFDVAQNYRDRWHARWGYLRTEYVHNDWMSSSFVGGPHGWMHPDGSIGYTDNVGKWPSVAALFDDWKAIAERWPFLELGVCLMSGESSEEDKTPIVGFSVTEGRVTPVDPTPGLEVVFKDYPRPQPRDFEAAVFGVAYLHPRDREHGVPPAWLSTWSLRAEELMKDDYIKTFGGPDAHR